MRGQPICDYEAFDSYGKYSEDNYVCFLTQ